MLNRLPGQVPPLSMMLDDIGRPTPRALARAFDVTERTARRWIATENAPLAVLLALFWLTRWGVSAIDAEAHNAAVMHAAMVMALRTEVDVLQRKLKRIGQIGDFGAANDPELGVALPLAVVPINAGPPDAVLRPHESTLAHAGTDAPLPGKARRR